MRADELQTLANVLDDTTVPRPTRRRLLQGAALGVASSAIAAPAALGHGGGESPKTILSLLATAESFGVTFLTEAVAARTGHAVGRTGRHAACREHRGVRPRPRAGGAGRRALHHAVLDPDALFGGGGVGLFESIETADTIELQGYLTGVTAFAQRGHERGARWLAEGCAIESEHRAIARFAQTALGGRQQIAIDRSFAPWGIRTAAGMIAALESAGIGFGRRGAGAGAFHEFPGDPVANGTGLVNNGRRPDEA